MKLMLLIVPALLIDALQAGVSMALTGFIVVAGAVPIVGPIIGAIATPVGIILGFVISVTLSLTLGGIVVFLLKWQGMLYPGIAAMAFIGEGLPGFNLLPSWTALVVASYVRHMGETSSGGVAALATAASLAANPRMAAMRGAQNNINFTAARGAVRTLVGNETSQRKETPSRVPVLPDKVYAKTA